METNHKLKKCYIDMQFLNPGVWLYNFTIDVMRDLGKELKPHSILRIMTGYLNYPKPKIPLSYIPKSQIHRVITGRKKLRRFTNLEELCIAEYGAVYDTAKLEKKIRGNAKYIINKLINDEFRSGPLFRSILITAKGLYEDVESFIFKMDEFMELRRLADLRNSEPEIELVMNSQNIYEPENLFQHEDQLQFVDICETSLHLIDVQISSQTRLSTINEETIANTSENNDNFLSQIYNNCKTFEEFVKSTNVTALAAKQLNALNIKESSKIQTQLTDIIIQNTWKQVHGHYKTYYTSAENSKPAEVQMTPIGSTTILRQFTLDRNSLHNLNVDEDKLEKMMTRYSNIDKPIVPLRYLNESPNPFPNLYSFVKYTNVIRLVKQIHGLNVERVITNSQKWYNDLCKYWPNTSEKYSRLKINAKYLCVLQNEEAFVDHNDEMLEEEICRHFYGPSFVSYTKPALPEGVPSGSSEVPDQKYVPHKSVQVVPEESTNEPHSLNSVVDIIENVCVTEPSKESPHLDPSLDNVEQLQLGQHEPHHIQQEPLIEGPIINEIIQESPTDSLNLSPEYILPCEQFAENYIPETSAILIMASPNIKEKLCSSPELLPQPESMIVMPQLQDLTSVPISLNKSLSARNNTEIISSKIMSENNANEPIFRDAKHGKIFDITENVCVAKPSNDSPQLPPSLDIVDLVQVEKQIENQHIQQEPLVEGPIRNVILQESPKGSMNLSPEFILPCELSREMYIPETSTMLTMVSPNIKEEICTSPELSPQPKSMIVMPQLHDTAAVSISLNNSMTARNNMVIIPTKIISGNNANGPIFRDAKMFGTAEKLFVAAPIIMEKAHIENVALLEDPSIVLPQLPRALDIVESQHIQQEAPIINEINQDSLKLSPELVLPCDFPTQIYIPETTTILGMVSPKITDQNLSASPEQSPKPEPMIVMSQHHATPITVDNEIKSYSREVDTDEKELLSKYFGNSFENLLNMFLKDIKHNNNFAHLSTTYIKEKIKEKIDDILSATSLTQKLSESPSNSNCEPTNSNDEIGADNLENTNFKTQSNILNIKNEEPTQFSPYDDEVEIVPIETEIIEIENSMTVSQLLASSDDDETQTNYQNSNDCFDMLKELKLNGSVNSDNGLLQRIDAVLDESRSVQHVLSNPAVSQNLELSYNDMIQRQNETERKRGRRKRTAVTENQENETIHGRKIKRVELRKNGLATGQTQHLTTMSQLLNSQISLFLDSQLSTSKQTSPKHRETYLSSTSQENIALQRATVKRKLNYNEPLIESPADLILAKRAKLIDYNITIKSLHHFKLINVKFLKKYYILNRNKYIFSQNIYGNEDQISATLYAKYDRFTIRNQHLYKILNLNKHQEHSLKMLLSMYEVYEFKTNSNYSCDDVSLLILHLYFRSLPSISQNAIVLNVHSKDVESVYDRAEYLKYKFDLNGFTGRKLSELYNSVMDQ